VNGFQKGGTSFPHMSALGQKQTFAPQKVMSALPPKADMCGATRDVRFGPKADINDIHSITASARASSEGGNSAFRRLFPSLQSVAA
jgi:hypothetical protein